MRPDRLGAHRTAFEKNRKIILATQTVCGICGLEIDPTYKSPHPLSATVDHIIPVAKGGHPSDLSNLQIAHRYCNQAKKDKLLVERYQQENQKNKKENEMALPQHFDWMNYRAENNAADGQKKDG